MRLFISITSSFLFFFSSPTMAQFGNLMKDLKGAAEAIQKSVQEAQPSKDGNPLSLPSAGGGVLSSEEYCKRFTGSPSVQALSKAMATLGKDSVKLTNDHTYLDNQNGDLEKWVSAKLATLPGRTARPPLTESQLFTPLIDIVNSCAQKNVNTDLFLVGARSDYTGGADSKFLLGGSIPLVTRPGKVGHGNRNSREATILAFLFDGAEDEIKKISPNPTASFSAAADSLKQHQKKLADNKAAEAEKEAQAQKRRAEAAAFEASPDGQLLYSYQHFQIVQLCHDIRKGLAVQFVTNNEISDFKSKMKQIENKLKGSVKDKNTDRIWQAAEKNNRNFGSIELDGKQIQGIDLVSVITSNNKSNWTSAKADCDLQVELFRNQIKEVLGNEKLKKSF
jgi:hypothetical protein